MTKIERLRALLVAHRPADEREQEFRDRMLELLASDEPFARDRFAPGHFTASAFVLSPDRQQLLLILHGKLGLWLQPGGHVEPGDLTLLHAARRELREEVGIDRVEPLGLIDLDIHDIPARAGEPAHQHFDVRFLFLAADERLVPASDAKAARWVPLSELERVQSDESVMRAARRLMP